MGCEKACRRLRRNHDVPHPEAVDATAKEIEEGGYLPVQRIKKPHDRGGYWDYKFNFYGPNGTVIELIVADDYILGIKMGLGHALYDYTRQIDEILDSANSGRLTIDPVKKSLLNDLNYNFPNQ